MERKNSISTSTAQKLKKHSRSRTGCFTCRKRRVKCDEEKPKCTRCDKGGRECEYPPPPAKLKKSSSKNKVESQERRPSLSSDSDESVTFGFSDDEYEVSPIVRFSSASSLDSPPAKSPREPIFPGVHLDNDVSTESLELAQELSEPLFQASNPTIAISEPAVSPKQFPESSFFREPTYAPNDASPGFICIPHCTSPIQPDFPEFFYLDYHRKNITEFHYFRYYDHHKQSNHILLQMAENSVALCHAVVAFSALVFSMTTQGSPGEEAFVYYDSSLREFRHLLETPLLNNEDIHIAVATALQLSAFDQFLGDTAKCYRHLQGAAYILTKFTDPVRLCSTPIGRSLLEWYCGVEDYCCSLAAYHALLRPAVDWRMENKRIRQHLAHEEYPHIAPSDQKPRLLDDLWPQLRAITPALTDVVAMIPVMQTMEPKDRPRVAAQLMGELRRFVLDLKGFLESSHVIEVLQPERTAKPVCSQHEGCCPDPPFRPTLLKFPPAGIFLCRLQCTQAYIRGIVYPALRAEFEDVIPEFEDHDASYYSAEVCKAYAGTELQFGDRPDIILACFAPLVIAARSCPPVMRSWLWSKLCHAEDLGLRFESIKRQLAEVWNMPELLVKVKFGGVENFALQNVGSGDGSLESLRRYRGVFGLQHEWSMESRSI